MKLQNNTKQDKNIDIEKRDIPERGVVQMQKELMHKRTLILSTKNEIQKLEKLS